MAASRTKVDVDPNDLKTHIPVLTKNGKTFHHNHKKRVCISCILCIWASTRETMSAVVCEQQRRIPACASLQPDQRLCYSLIEYEGCSNMNASSFITFFTYMLRQNVIPFWKELFVAFKMAPNIKKHSLYFSSYKPLYKRYSCILEIF